MSASTTTHPPAAPASAGGGAGRPQRRPPAGVAVLVCAALVVPAVLALGRFQLTAVYLLAGLSAALTLGWLRRDAIGATVRTARQQLRLGLVRVGRPAAQDLATPARAAATRSRTGASLGMVMLVALLGGLAAWLVAQLGARGLVAAAGAAVVVAVLVYVADRTLFFTFALVSSLALLLHKSVGPQDLGQAGGAISVYVTSFDVLLVLLYVLWLREGTFLADVRRGIRSPLVWLPLAALLLLLPSLLVAPSLGHATAELVRMGWMYLLYAYVALRVRSRAQVWAVLAGLATIAAVELVVVVLQWRTGGVLGLDFLGVPTALGQRTTDTEVIGRPFGTIIHPVFMAAALGIIALIAYALAIELERSLARYAAVAVTVSCLACMWISQTRASFVAALVAGAVLTVLGLRRRRIGWRSLGRFALAAVVLVALGWSRISDTLAVNFGTGHFAEEVASRHELNQIALRMAADYPLLGVGLNNFETVLPRYQANPVIFHGNPVHNLYLLYLAEVGVVGLLGVVVLGAALGYAAVQLGRSQDRLLAGIGIGVAGAMGFLALEELLGFSLRQDVPLALYWLAAGLAVAGLRMSGRNRTRSVPPRTAVGTGHHPGARRVAVGSLVLALVLLVAPLVPALPGLVPAQAATKPGLLFTAYERSTKIQGIYAADADGTNAHRITPPDGRNYNWPRLVFGNTKIVYTVRSGNSGSPEDIRLMNPDGSGDQLLRHFDYRVAQPVIDPTGSWLTFTARAPFYSLAGLYRMNLATGETINLSAVGLPNGALDADPFLTVEGKYLAFVQNNAGTGANIVRMNPDGTNRQILTDNRYFNTDPVITADRQLMAIASFRGEGPPTDGEGVEDFSGVRPDLWSIVVQKTYGGRESEKVLTTGAKCTSRFPSERCTVPEMSGFVPQITPDQKSVSFTGALDYTTTCICEVSLDGATSRVILESAELAINWHTWPQAAGASTDTSRILSAPRGSRLLVTRTNGAGPNVLVIASADMMDQKVIPLPNGLSPLESRFGPDGRTIVFTAKVPVGATVSPHPAAPAGQKRTAHISRFFTDPTAAAIRAAYLQQNKQSIMEQQVFLRTTDGKVRQLSDPWTEDYRDGLAAGDKRGSSQPRISPDGKSVVVTNTSTLTGESFLLRIVIKTGAVTNLTTAARQTVPSDDGDATFSPDGKRLAFGRTVGGVRGLYSMNAANGTDVTAMAKDAVGAFRPHWSPKGGLVTYMSDRAGGFAIIRAPLNSSNAAGTRTLISNGKVAAAAPVVAPEGDRIVYIARVGPVNGLWRVKNNATTAYQVQATPSTSVVWVDWGRKP